MEIPFGAGTARALGVGRVAEEQQHAGIAQLLEARHVGRQPVRRRVVQLEVASVDHPTDRGFNGERDCVGDRVADCDRLDLERAKLDGIADAHLAQVCLAQDAMLLQLGLDESERQPVP